MHRHRKTPWRYRSLLKYALPYRRAWASVVGLTLVGTILGLLQPWPMKVLVDNILGSTPLNGAANQFLSVLPGAASRFGLLSWVAFAGLAIYLINSVHADAKD